MSRPAIARAAACSLLLGAMACRGGEEVPASVPDAPDGSIELSEAQVRAAGIETTVVVHESIREEVYVPGSVQSPDTAHSMVGSIVEGQVMLVRVLPGDRVRRGQPLVEIHAHELTEALRDLATAEAEVEFTRNALDRSEKLLDAGAVALEEVERRRADHAAARAELTHAEDVVAHLYPSSDGDVRAVAPSDGTVFAVHVRAGQAVVPGELLVELGATEPLWVTAFVPEHTASTLTVGHSVSVRFDAPPASTTARLVRAGNYVDAANRSVEMRFELDSIPVGVRPGSFATVAISAGAVREGVELGGDASVRLGDDDVVFVVVGPGRYRPVKVSVAHLSGGLLAVQGLPPDAEVVVSGAYFLKAALESAATGGGTP